MVENDKNHEPMNRNYNPDNERMKEQQPKEMSWGEMRQCLIQAGWKPHEADAEIDDMMKDEEAGE